VSFLELSKSATDGTSSHMRPRRVWRLCIAVMSLPASPMSDPASPLSPARCLFTAQWSQHPTWRSDCPQVDCAEEAIAGFQSSDDEVGVVADDLPVCGCGFASSRSQYLLLMTSPFASIGQLSCSLAQFGSRHMYMPKASHRPHAYLCAIMRVLAFSI
jgi:hypothetical protein